MAAILPSSTGCLPCDGGSPSCQTGSVPIPGIQGPAGNAGANGANAYTKLTASLTVPAPAATVAAVVESTEFMVPGQVVYLQSAGSYQVASVTDLNDVVLTCLNYAGDAVEGTVIAIGQKIVPAGLQGPAGASGSGVTSVGLSMPSLFTVAGSPVTGSSTLSVTFTGGQTQDRVLATPDGASGALALIALTPGHIPSLPAAKITSGQIAIANGGTGQNSATSGFNALAPTTTTGDLIVFSTSSGLGNVRLPVGTSGQCLISDPTQTTGLRWDAMESIQASTPTTGGNVVFNTSPQNIMLYLTPAGTLATLSVSLPADANSFVGQFCRVFTTQALTALSVAAPSGTIAGATVTTLAQYGVLIFQKVASNAWIRLN